MYSRRRSEGEIALVVSPGRAQQMLDCGEARVYELLKTGELRSYKDGKSRKILVASVHAYIERKLAEAAAGQAA
jgi:excisionase family DNA binding protein